MSKRELKKKQRTLKTLSKATVIGGITLGIVLMCVGFALLGSGLIWASLLGAFVCGVLGITAGVVINNKAEKISFNDNENYIVNDFVSDKEQSHLQVKQKENTNTKQSQHEDGLTL